MERKDQTQGALLRRWYTKDVLEGFWERLLPVNTEIAQIEAALQAVNPRPNADAIIAATALNYRLILVTRNVTDFDGTGVIWLNPWTGESSAYY